MPRFSHGSVLLDEAPVLGVAGINVADNAANTNPNTARFGFLFPELQEDPAKNLLAESKQTVADLIALGIAMDHTENDNPPESTVPAVFTYFGQFITHDISWEKGTKDILLTSDLSPWSIDQIESIENRRSSRLDLDSIYGDVEFPVLAHDTGALLVGNIAAAASRPPNKDNRNDVPRKDRDWKNPKEDRAAIIGDPRNDENVILSQLHVAFLRAHNKLMEDHSFEEARTELVRLYQSVVIHDFLRRVILPDVLQELRLQPDRIYGAPSESLFMPLEFSAAALRFGHSMIRRAYELNLNFLNNGELDLPSLFGIPHKYDQLPESWIIEWERFLDGGRNKALQINTRLVEPLSLMKAANGLPFTDQPKLAVRDLLRGYVLRLPTGQAVARALGVVDRISPDELKAVVPEPQWNVLVNSGFVEKTPLWFYILAEAARERRRHLPQEDYLGPVGSKVVAGVLMGLLLKSKDSILKDGSPPLGTAMEDLLRLAGVLPANGINS